MWGARAVRIGAAATVASRWPRRAWLQAVGIVFPGVRSLGRWPDRSPHAVRGQRMGAVAGEHIPLTTTGPWATLALQAVDAAHAAGARYAEAHVTKTLLHHYDATPSFGEEDEIVGVGVRVLVGQTWGFAASALVTPEEGVRVARDAVTQAQSVPAGMVTRTGRQVELAIHPPVQGTWTTPIAIDPFTISIEEKLDWLQYLKRCLAAAGLALFHDGPSSVLGCIRHEHVLATSEGTLVVQTRYETGAKFDVILAGDGPGAGADPAMTDFANVGVVGAGWERLLQAGLPDQIASGAIRDRLLTLAAVRRMPVTIGRYPIVCDGATLAAVTEQTLGLTTQLDRALGYEANASGTTMLDDPLGQVGELALADPAITVTANRSAPGDLATVGWDAEGVAPSPFPLITQGRLVDFQTTREQASWLAPYYARRGMPVRSHGCAAVQDAHAPVVQQLPNLTVAPAATSATLADLIATVPHGIYVEGGQVMQVDSQGRSMLLSDEGLVRHGRMWEIRNGRVGRQVTGGAVLLDGGRVWQQVTAVGGAATMGVLHRSSIDVAESIAWMSHLLARFTRLGKGEPPQWTSHTVRAPAAILAPQAMINPLQRGG